MKRMLLLAALVAAVAAPAMAAKGNIEISGMGIGIGVDAADFRVELSPRDAVGVTMQFATLSGDMDGSQFGIGFNYLHRLAEPKPVAMHFIGGLMINSYDKLPFDFFGTPAVGAKFTMIKLYGGIGAEYFFPGTDRFSIEGNTGIGIVSVSGDGKGTLFGIAPVPSSLVMFRYYFSR